MSSTLSDRLNRRHVLGAFAALLPLSASPLFAGISYKPGLVDAELAKGNTVFLDFTASWCSTCARQARVINQLKSENAAYENAMTFIDVDWDEYRRADLTRRLRVPRRSTLIALKGDAEIGRIVAGTSEAEIKALMDAALAASS